MKECTNENPVEGKENTVEILKQRPKLEDRKGNDNNKMTSSGKSRPNNSIRGARTKHTAPHPFALATAKHTSSGTHPTGAEVDPAITDHHKSLSGKPLHKPSSKKLSQVNFINWVLAHVRVLLL